MKKILLPLIGAVAVAGLAVSCSSGSGSGGTSSSTNSSVGGKLSSLSVSSFNSTVGKMTAKTITHVMAVSPSSSYPERFVAQVQDHGTFSLGVNSGSPYMIVFVAQDGTLTGPDMIAGIVKVTANQLDTLPIAQAGAVQLGDVAVDGTAQTATPSTTVADLLATLGVTSAEASFIGGIDDLALRLANPDIDMNGVIDASEGKAFGMDWHVRANTYLTTNPLRMSDIENTFATAADVELDFNLTSAYAVYPTSFDNVDYINGNALHNGGGFADTGTNVNPTSYSGGTFGDMRQWGPDYNMTSAEMGASDATSVFTYTLGSKTLKFSNVRTKLKADLGSLIPFVKLNTSGGLFTGISYKWMKRSGTTWVDATVAEIGLLVQSRAYISLNTSKDTNGSTGVAFSIPADSSSGTINVTDSTVQVYGVSDVNTLTLDMFCSSAVSYDDKMGLRIFAGAPWPNASTTPCP